MARETSNRRWEGLSPAEFHLIHHALRVLAKYLSDFDTDKALANKLADEMWNLHAQSTSDFWRPTGECPEC